MKTPLLSILFFIIAALFGAVGQYFYKSGADKATTGPLSYLNWRIILGVICYSAVMVLFVAAFKRGGQLQVLYPIYASTFIFGAIIAWQAYGAPIRPIHIMGMGCLILGMFLMGK